MATNQEDFKREADTELQLAERNFCNFKSSNNTYLFEFFQNSVVWECNEKHWNGIWNYV